jgi:hypothetical protein
MLLTRQVSTVLSVDINTSCIYQVCFIVTSAIIKNCLIYQVQSLSITSKHHSVEILIIQPRLWEQIRKDHSVIMQRRDI